MTTLVLPGIHHYLLPPVPSVIAREYPGHPDRIRAIKRLRLPRQAGVTVFINLTQDGELEPYAPLLGR